MVVKLDMEELLRVVMSWLGEGLSRAGAVRA